MILVTGGTGFIGQVLIRQLVEEGRAVRTLIHPSRRSPNLPRGVPVEAIVCSIHDRRGLRAAMKGVNAVYHLAGMEGVGARADLMGVDIRGTEAVVQVAGEAGVERFFYLSHIGADRASAYPVLKAKAIAEHAVRQSGLAYTILRSAVAFGPGDGLTTGLSTILRLIPFIFLLPGDGSTIIQPIYVEDLARCLMWAFDDPAMCNQVVTIGGVDYLPFRQVVETIRDLLGYHHRMIGIGPAYLRVITVLLEHMIPRFPLSVFWLDYLAANRTCPIDSITRIFGLLPNRFHQNLGYLKSSFPTRGSKGKNG